MTVTGARVWEPAADGRLFSVPPDRTMAQRMSALDRANEIRTRRAHFKRDVKAGRASAIDAILEPPDWMETMKVMELMLAVPKWGRVKVNKALKTTLISPSKTLGGLSQRQRAELAGLLPRVHRDLAAGRTVVFRESVRR